MAAFVVPGLHSKASVADGKEAEIRAEVATAPKDPGRVRLPAVAAASALAALVLAGCLGATYLFWRAVESDLEHEADHAFAIRAEHTVARIEDSLAMYQRLLLSAAWVVSGSGEASHDALHAYVESLNPQAQYPAVVGIGFARLEGSGREPAARVEFLEPPSERNAQLVGSDLFGDPAQRKALVQSRDEGRIVMSPKVLLNPANTGPPRLGVLLAVPVLRPEDPRAIPGKPPRLLGWVFVRLSVHDMVHALLTREFGASRERLGLKLFDGASIDGEHLLFATIEPPWRSESTGRERRTELPIHSAGHEWTVALSASPDFLRDGAHGQPRLLTVAGVAFSISLAVLTWFLATGRVRARLVAARMNARLIESEGLLRDANQSLERRIAERTLELEAAAQRLQLAVAVSDTGLADWDLRSGRVHYSGEWIRQVGGQDTEVGETIAELRDRLHPEDRERTLAPLTGPAARPGEPIEVEYRLRHNDGRYRTMLARARVLGDATGEPARILVSQVDITARKQAEDAMARLTRDLRRVSQELSQSEEAERRRIARELHDSIGATLSALNLGLAAVRSRLGSGSREELDRRLDNAFALLKDSQEAVRGLMVEMRPPVLDDYGLAAALRWYASQINSQGGPAVTVSVVGDERRLPTETEIALFRIAQGAITNALRHASATRILIVLVSGPEGTSLAIEDDGRGFDPDSRADSGERPSWGIVIMRERAMAVGGRLAIESAPGRGTRVTVELG